MALFSRKAARVAAGQAGEDLNDGASSAGTASGSPRMGVPHASTMLLPGQRRASTPPTTKHMDGTASMPASAASAVSAFSGVSGSSAGRGAAPRSAGGRNSVPGVPSSGDSVTSGAGGGGGGIGGLFGGGGGPKIDPAVARKLAELENLMRTTQAATENLKAIVAHNALMETLREDGICPLGHKMQPVGTTMDDGWICNGCDDECGCLSLITKAGQSHGLNRFRCDECDYDLCQPCYHRAAKEDIKMRELKEEIMASLSGRMAEIEGRLNRVAAVEEHQQILDEVAAKVAELERRCNRDDAELRAKAADLEAQVGRVQAHCVSVKARADAGADDARRLATRLDGALAKERQRLQGKSSDDAAAAAPLPPPPMAGGAAAADLQQPASEGVGAAPSPPAAGSDGEAAAPLPGDAVAPLPPMAGSGGEGPMSALCAMMEAFIVSVSTRLDRAQGMADEATIAQAELARRFERRLDELESHPTGRKIEAQVERLHAQLSLETKALRTQEVGLERGLAKIGKTAQELECVALRVEKAEKLGVPLGALPARETSDEELMARERRILERIDVLAAHIGSIWQSVERRFRELRSDRRMAASRPSSARMLSVGLPPQERWRSPPPLQGSSELSVAAPPDGGGGWGLRFEWDISSKDLSDYRGPRCFDSPDFALGGVNGLRLRFHPFWTSTTCLAALLAPRGLGLACRLLVDGQEKDGAPLDLGGEGPEHIACYAAEFPARPSGGGGYQRVAVELTLEASISWPPHRDIALTARPDGVEVRVRPQSARRR